MFGYAAFSEVPFATLGGAAANVYNVTVSESATAADVVSALGTFLNFIQETATAVDSVFANADFLASVADSATVIDQASGSLLLLSNIDESASGSDQVSGNVELGGSIQESATGTESVISIVTLGPLISEQADASDQVSVIGDFFAAVQEVATVTDQPLGGVVFVVNLQDSALGLDEVSASPSSRLMWLSLQRLRIRRLRFLSLVRSFKKWVLQRIVPRRRSCGTLLMTANQ